MVYCFGRLGLLGCIRFESSRQFRVPGAAAGGWEDLRGLRVDPPKLFIPGTLEKLGIWGSGLGVFHSSSGLSLQY